MKLSPSKRSISAFAKYHNTSNEIKERILQDSLSLKTQLNKYKEEVFLQRKANEESIKENRDLSAMVDKLLSDSNIVINQPELYKKINEAFIVIELKKEIKGLAQEIKSKQQTIDEYKKNIKITQKHEFSIENEIIMKEMAKVKTLYLEALKELAYYKSKSIEVMKLKNEFVKQNYIILSLNEKNNLYLKELKSKSETIEEMNKKINDKEVWYKNARIKLNYHQKLNSELIKNSLFSNCIKTESNQKFKIVNSNVINRNKSFLLIKRQFKVNRNINNNSNSNMKMNTKTESNLLKEKEKRYHRTNTDNKKMNKSFQDKRIMEPIMTELSENDYKEISYILMKSIEGKDFSSNQLEQMITTEKDKETIAKENITELTALLWKKLCNILSIKEKNDSNSIYSFAKCFLKNTYSNNISNLSSNHDLMKDFIDFYFSIASNKSITDTAKLNKSLKDFLKNNREVLLNEFKSIDSNNTGLISFKDLKIILNETKIDIAGELLEFLIYQMKKSKKCSLHQLDYSILPILLADNTEAEEHSEANHITTISNNNNNGYNEEEEDLKMTQEEYNAKTKEMLAKIVNSIISNKTTLTNILLLSQKEENEHISTQHKLRVVETIQLLQSQLHINLTKIEVIIFYNKYSNISESNYDEGIESLNENLFYEDINSVLIPMNKFLQGISLYLNNKGLEFKNFLSLVPNADIIKSKCSESLIENSFIDLISIQPLLTKCQIEIDDINDRIPILFTDNKINLNYLSFIFTCLPQTGFIPFNESNGFGYESSLMMEEYIESLNHPEEDLQYE